jgi:hypothetical protein
MARVWLTLRDAAKRVRSTERTVKRWQAAGLATEWRDLDGQRVRVVEEDTLLAYWRERMDASPVHQARIRARMTELGLAYTPPPRPPRPAKSKPATVATVDELVDDAAAEAEQPRPYEPLDHMKPMAGRAEYSRLAKALRRTPTPCKDVDAFTADPTPAEQLDTLAAMCAACPLTRLCAAYAAAGRPAVGFWAGVAVGRVSAVEAVPARSELRHVSGARRLDSFSQDTTSSLV